MLPPKHPRTGLTAIQTNQVQESNREPKNVQDSEQSTFCSPLFCFPNSLPYPPGKQKEMRKGRMAKIARSMIRIRFLRRITRIRKCLHTSRKWKQEPAAFYCLWPWMYAHIILASTNRASSEIISWFFVSLTTHTSPVQESILLLGHPSFCDYKINLHQNISLNSPCLHIAFHCSTIYQILGIFRCVRFHSMSIDNEKGG